MWMSRWMPRIEYSRRDSPAVPALSRIRQGERRDQAKQRVERERLGQVVIEADQLAKNPVRSPVVDAADRDQQGLALAILLADFLRDLKAAGVRQLDIEQHD